MNNETVQNSAANNLMTHEQAVATIEQVLVQLRPTIALHGGDVEFVSLQNDIVHVRFSGACVGCPISQLTLKQGIEQAIMAQVPQVSEVVSVDE